MIRDAIVTPFRLPLAKVLKTASGSTDCRRGVLLQLRDSNGFTGLGEATPIRGFGLELIVAANRALISFIPQIIGREVEDGFGIIDAFIRQYPMARCACSALDTALCDLQAQRAGLPLSTWLASVVGVKAAERIQQSYLLTYDGRASLCDELDRVEENGFSVFKLKIGTRTLEEECSDIQYIRQRIGAEGRIRLDANCAWDESGAASAIKAFMPFSIEFIEQPVAPSRIDALASLKAQHKIPIAADEAVIDLSTCRQVLDKQAADILILKPSALGGPRTTLQIASMAVEASIPVVVTSLMDGAVARAMAVHCASVVDSFNQVILQNSSKWKTLAHGTATGSHLSMDLFESPIQDLGDIAIPGCPGLGFQISENALQKVVTGAEQKI